MASKRPQVTAAADLTGGFIKALKARGQEVGVWESRGKILARVLAAMRDARLSGAECRVLANISLHLTHLGRSKGMMTVASLADDCMTTERTVRNALRVLEAVSFITVRFRLSGQMTLMLARGFGPKVHFKVGKSSDGSPRRCAPRKKISTTRNSNVPLSFLVTDECTDSAPTRRESNGEGLRPGTAQRPPNKCPVTDPAHVRKHHVFGNCYRLVHKGAAYEFHQHDPPRKRAAPVASG